MLVNPHPPRDTIRDHPRTSAFRLVGGKGGVGKTTCAAALAIHSALEGTRTLVLSTDPAPSLGDALGTPLGGTPTRVPLPRGRLDAVEIEARKALERWLKPRRPILQAIALRGTWLDEDDVGQLLRLSLPGIDELAALIEMLRFGRSGLYDVVVVDTAPTGHTLRMLAMPETLGAMSQVFDDMQAKHRALAGALGGSVIDDEAEALLEELRADARALAGMLRNPHTTELMLVSLPELLAVEETIDAVRALVGSGIPVARVAVNRLTPPPPERCSWCDARRRLERAALAALSEELDRRAAADRPMLVHIAAREREPVGFTALRRIATELGDRRIPQRARATRPVVAQRFAAPPVATSDHEFEMPSARLLLFGGKGGVGKTTCAAAAALRLAKDEPSRRVLLVSTDPAHSLADVLQTPLSDTPAAVQGGPRNLLARELDATRALDDVRRKYAASIDEWFDGLAGGSAFDAAHDRRVMHDLLALAPPGLDELAAVMDLTELLGSEDGAGSFDSIVMDTAPTGHARRLLEMPGTAQEWTRALMSILLKYQPVVRLGELGVALLRISRGLGRLQELLSDPRVTRFVVVTRAAALPRAETRRLVRRLRRLRISTAAVVINAAGAGACARCRRGGRQDSREIARLAAELPALTIVVAPAAVPAPVGSKSLVGWRRRWRVVD